MALSGTIKGTTNNRFITAKLDWSAEQNKTENYTTITATLYYSRTNEGYTTKGEWQGAITINGTTVSAKKRIEITYQSNTNAMSATVKVPHNPDGTKTCAISASGGFPGLSMTTTNLSANVELDEIARQATITTAPDFNDEDNPTITYTNKAGSAVSSLQACISLTGETDDIAYRDVSLTEGTYTFELTDAERKILRTATIAKSRTVVFILRTVLNGSTYYSTATKTLSIVNGSPLINPTVVDSNPITVALTGNSARMVRYYSNAQYSVGAQAVKEATLTGVRVSCGGKSATTATGTLTGVESGDFVFSATDSRGYTTTQTVKTTIINYVKLTCNCGASTPTAQGSMTLTIEGNYYNAGFGAQPNTLTISYRQKVNEGSYSGWTTTTATLSGNTYSAKITLEGLDYQSKYTYQARAEDALTAVNSAEKSVKTTPVFDWSKDDFRHNTDVIMGKQAIIKGTRQNGDTVAVFTPCDSNNKTVIGYDNYNANVGETNIYGAGIGLYTKDKLTINGREYGQNRLLWTGANQMDDTQTITLNEAVSAQISGIMLVFSLFINGEVADTSINSFFISKKEVELLPNAGHVFYLLKYGGFDIVGAKYLKINDTAITGDSINILTGSNNNATYTNNNFVLRYVIGV